MVSVIIPTKNRIDWLSKVLDSYVQSEVSEIIIIDDGSTIPVKLTNFDQRIRDIITIVRNDVSKGAPYCRNRGVLTAKNEIILFGEDDVFLDPYYVHDCTKYLSFDNVNIVCGQIYFLNVGEYYLDAHVRIKESKAKRKLFSFYRHHGVITDVRPAYKLNFIPYTHAIFITHRTLLLKHPFNESFATNGGFREESSAQLKIFTGEQTYALMQNESSCWHVARQEVRSGGQRTNRIKRWVNAVINTTIFLKDFRYSKLRYTICVISYFCFSVYAYFFRPLKNLLK